MGPETGRWELCPPPAYPPGGLDMAPERAYKHGREVCPMLELSKRNKPDLDDRKVIFLEFVAASTIFFIIALVLYMVFTYRPA
jgi:hypothetical protein